MPRSADTARAELPQDPLRCPICKLGRLLVIEFVGRIWIEIPDTS